MFYIYCSELISVRNSTYFTQQLNQCNLIFFEEFTEIRTQKMHIWKTYFSRDFLFLSDRQPFKAKNCRYIRTVCDYIQKSNQLGGYLFADMENIQYTKEKLYCISAYCKRESQLIEKSLLLFFFSLWSWVIPGSELSQSSQSGRSTYTVKKRFVSFPSPAGMSLPNSPWAGIMTS
jgi:hypothetical protein